MELHGATGMSTLRIAMAGSRTQTVAGMNTGDVLTKAQVVDLTWVAGGLASRPNELVLVLF